MHVPGGKPAPLTSGFGGKNQNCSSGSGTPGALGCAIHGFVIALDWLSMI